MAGLWAAAVGCQVVGLRAGNPTLDDRTSKLNHLAHGRPAVRRVEK